MSSTDHIIRGDVHSCAQAQNSLTAVGGAFTDLIRSVGQAIANLEGKGVSGEPIDLLVSARERYTELAASAEQRAARFGELVAIQRDRILSNPDLAGTVTGTWFDPALS